MAAVDGEAVRGRQRLGKWLLPTSLAGNSGLGLLLHLEGGGDNGALPWLGRLRRWTEVAGDVEQSSGRERGRAESER
jgi:hypothetical protein